MINTLKFSVTFPHTGRTFSQDLTFDQGITRITGSNEAGKSLILEIAEFCLYGASALRGAATDYKTLQAEMAFVVRDKPHRVVRTARGADLYDAEGTLMVTGTKPVNVRLLKILGFNLDVFRVACIANQGDVERLSKMLPTQRKAMVDKLIGADQIGEVATFCNDEAKGLLNQIAGSERNHIQPVAPEPTEEPRSVGELEALVSALRERQRDLFKHEAFLAHPVPAPTKPVQPHKHKPEALDAALALLSRPVCEMDVAAERAKVAAWDLWGARQWFVKKHFPRPTITADEAEAAGEYGRLDMVLKGLRKAPTIVCPCGKPFTTADAEIARVEAEQAALVLPTVEYDLRAEQHALMRWSDPKTVATWADLEPITEPAEPALYSEKQIAQAETGITPKDLAAGLKKLQLVDATTGSVKAWQRDHVVWQAQEAAYGPALAKHEAWVTAATKIQDLVLELQSIVAVIPETEEALARARDYQRAVDRFRSAHQLWEEREADLAAMRTQHAAWAAARAGLNDLRAEVKTFLVPSLSRAASALLNQMTAGARNTVVVDEDFEIMVDGQPLNTLSGSGKVCVNLALRIGLGQILTRGVMPVFMGDEMDSSMDQERVDHLYQCLGNLRARMKQIIFITHKNPQADHLIQV